MAVGSNISSKTFPGDGVNTTYSLDAEFKVPTNAAGAPLVTVTIEDATGVAVSTDNFTAAFVNDVCVVTYPTTGDALPAGSKLTVTKNSDFLQGVDLQPNAKFLSEVVEDALDKLTLQDQQLAEQVGRAVQAPPGQTSENYYANLTTLKNDAETAKTGAETARTAAEAAQASAESAAGTAATDAAAGVATQLSGYVTDATTARDEAVAAKNAAEAAELTVSTIVDDAAAAAVAAAEQQLDGYVTDATNAKNEAVAAKDTAVSAKDAAVAAAASVSGDAAQYNVGTADNEIPLNSMISIDDKLGPVNARLQRLDFLVANSSPSDQSIYTDLPGTVMDEFEPVDIMRVLDPATTEHEVLSPSAGMVAANKILISHDSDAINTLATGAYKANLVYDSGAKTHTCNIAGAYAGMGLPTPYMDIKTNILIAEFEINEITQSNNKINIGWGVNEYPFGQGSNTKPDAAQGGALYLEIANGSLSMNGGGTDSVKKMYSNASITNGAKIKFIVSYNNRTAFIYAGNELYCTYTLDVSDIAVTTTASFGFSLHYTGASIKNVACKSCEEVFNRYIDVDKPFNELRLVEVVKTPLDIKRNAVAFDEQPESATLLLQAYGGPKFIFSNDPTTAGPTVYVVPDKPYFYEGFQEDEYNGHVQAGDTVIYDTGSTSEKSLKMSNLYNLNNAGYAAYDTKFSGSDSLDGPWETLLENGAASFTTPAADAYTMLDVPPVVTAKRYIKIEPNSGATAYGYFRFWNIPEPNTGITDIVVEVSRDGGVTWVNAPVSIFAYDSDLDNYVLKASADWPDGSPAGKDFTYRIQGHNGFFGISAISVQTDKATAGSSSISSGDGVTLPIEMTDVTGLTDALAGKEATLTDNQKQRIILSTDDPSGVDWDVWIKHEA